MNENEILAYIAWHKAIKVGCRHVLINAEPDYLTAEQNIQRYLASYITLDPGVSWGYIVSKLVEDFNRVLPEHLHIVLK